MGLPYARSYAQLALSSGVQQKPFLSEVSHRTDPLLSSRGKGLLNSPLPLCFSNGSRRYPANLRFTVHASFMDFSVGSPCTVKSHRMKPSKSTRVFQARLNPWAVLFPKNST